MASDVFSRFAVVGVLSDAPTSEVLLAVDQRSHRRLAIKILRAAPDRNSARAIVRLGRQLSALDHPNVVRVFETGLFEHRPYAVMEYVDGITLERVLEQGRLPLATALDVSEQIAGALSAIHEIGIAHRDLKPGNVLIESGWQVKLMDFGIAVSRSEEHRIDPPASDVYAFAEMAFRLCTGAYTVREWTSTALSAALDVTPAISDAWREALTAMLVTMLGARPELRPSMREVRANLRALRDALPSFEPVSLLEEANDRAVNGLLEQTFSSRAAAERWLALPNQILGGRAPADLLRQRDYARVEAALDALNSGVYV